MPQCDEHTERALVCRSRRRQTQCSIDCIPNYPRYVRGTQNDLPQNDRKAPTGIAVNPQAAREIESNGILSAKFVSAPASVTRSSGTHQRDASVGPLSERKRGSASFHLP